MTRLFAGTPFDRPPVCDRCGALESDCQCPPLDETAEMIPPEQQLLKIAVEKRRKGKTVTAVHGLATNGMGAVHLLTRLKSTCGAGGTYKDGVLEIQGEHAGRVSDTLRQLGYRIRK